jgi:hypothetical protein
MHTGLHPALAAAPNWSASSNLNIEPGPAGAKLPLGEIYDQEITLTHVI